MGARTDDLNSVFQDVHFSLDDGLADDARVSVEHSSQFGLGRGVVLDQSLELFGVRVVADDHVPHVDRQHRGCRRPVVRLVEVQRLQQCRQVLAVLGDVVQHGPGQVQLVHLRLLAEEVRPASFQHRQFVLVAARARYARCRRHHTKFFKFCVLKQPDILRWR